MALAVQMGCRGGTTNPPLILKAARADQRWLVRARELADRHSPHDGARVVADEIRIAAARELMPVFTQTQGREGRLCVQVDPRMHEDADAMVEQALELNQLAPNLYIKIPLTSPGLLAMRRLLELGVWVTATVSFTVSQVLAATRMYAEFLDDWGDGGAPGLAAVLMVGRVDDYLRALNEHRKAMVPESVITQAGVAIAKRTYRILREQRLPGLLLLAAPRGAYHITEFLEMDAVMTAGQAVRQLVYDSPGIIAPGTGPSDEALRALAEAFPEFSAAYEPDALTPSEFLGYGATQRTLSEFISAQEELERLICECAAASP